MTGTSVLLGQDLVCRPGRCLVVFRTISLTASLFIFLLFPARGDKIPKQPRAMKTRVMFLATSWVIRGTWGRNEDQYFAEISATPRDTPSYAYVVDNYQCDTPSLSFDVLTSHSGTTLRLIRDSRCDIPFGQLALRTAPGDLRAILPGRFGYRPAITPLPNPDTMIPCYHIARK